MQSSHCPSNRVRPKFIRFPFSLPLFTCLLHCFHTVFINWLKWIQSRLLFDVHLNVWLMLSAVDIYSQRVTAYWFHIDSNHIFINSLHFNWEMKLLNLIELFQTIHHQWKFDPVQLINHITHTIKDKTFEWSWHQIGLFIN